MPYVLPVTLQAATTIAKTTQTVIGDKINVEKARYITVYLNYTKGDETGLYVYPYFISNSGTEYALCDWAVSAGVYTGTVIKVGFTATATRAITFDVRGQRYFKLYQGGSNNDGTPTGTLAVAYDLKE